MKVEIKELNDTVSLESFYEEGNNNLYLRDAIANSKQCWVAFIDNVVIAVWGVMAPNILSDDCYVWLTGSKLIELHPLVFARWSHEALKTLDAYPELHGLVLADFNVSQRWLKWLGFEVGAAEGKVRPFWRSKHKAVGSTIPSLEAAD